MLVGMEDVSTAFENPPSYTRHKSGLIRTMQKRNKRG
jgi:hypothetical protein